MGVRRPPCSLTLQGQPALRQWTLLKDRDAFLADVLDRLLQAQEYAKKYYDGHHRPLEFAVNDWCGCPWYSVIMVFSKHIHGKYLPEMLSSLTKRKNTMLLT